MNPVVPHKPWITPKHAQWFDGPRGFNRTQILDLPAKLVEDRRHVFLGGAIGSRLGLCYRNSMAV
jgi:hypothetical protein